jgi:maltose O-acetyltransferase
MCVVLDSAPVNIGSNVFLRLMFSCIPLHPLEADLRRTLEVLYPLIGDDCWIGGNSVICQESQLAMDAL